MPILGIGVAIAVIAHGSWLAPGGYDWSSSLNGIFVLLGAGWAAGLALRIVGNMKKLAATLEALFVALCFLSTLMAAALVIGGGGLIDPTLAALDARLFPFLDWREFVLSLSGRTERVEMLGET